MATENQVLTTAVSESRSIQPFNLEQIAALRRFLVALFWVLVVHTVLTLGTGTIPYLSDIWWRIFGVGLAHAVNGLIAYRIAKRGRMQLAVVWLSVFHIALLIMTALLIPFPPFRYFAFVYLLGPVMVAAVFYSLRFVLLLTGINLTVVALGVAFIPDFEGNIFVHLFTYIGAIAVISAYNRGRLEASQQQALSALEMRFQALLEIAFGGVVLVEDGRIHTANDGFCEIFRCEDTDCVGQHLSNFIPEIDTHWATAVANGDLLVLHGRALSGGRLMLELAVEVTPNQPRSYWLAVRDVTVMQHSETRMRQNQSVLEMRVREQTEDLRRSNMQLRVQNNRLELFNQLTTAVSHTLKLPEIFNQVYQMLAENLEITGGLLFLYEPADSMLTLQYIWGVDEQIAKPLLARLMPSTLGLEMVVAEQELQCNSRLDVLSGLFGDLPEIQVWQSHLSLPLLGRGQVQGVLSLFSRQPGKFQSENLDLYSLFAQHIGETVQNGRLYEAEQQARITAETISQANLALSQSLELDSVLIILLDYVQKLIPFDSGNVMLLEKGEEVMRIRAALGYGDIREEVKKMAIQIAEFPTFQQMKKALRPVLIPDTSRDLNWVNVELLEKPGIGSWLGVPLGVHEQVVR